MNTPPVVTSQMIWRSTWNISTSVTAQLDVSFTAHLNAEENNVVVWNASFQPLYETLQPLHKNTPLQTSAHGQEKSQSKVR